MDFPDIMVFANKCVASLSEGVSGFSHQFGTECRVVEGRTICRLLEIDFADPVVPIPESFKGSVQLLYSFDFRQRFIGYVWDAPKQIYFGDVAEFPDDTDGEARENDYTPPPMTPRSLVARQVRYDPADVDHALAFANVFGIDGLSTSDRKKIVDEATGMYLNVMEEPPESDKELWSFYGGPLVQGSPNCHCINPECSDSGSGRNVVPFCLVSNTPVEGLVIVPGMRVQFTFELCVSCGMILASSQCD